MPSLLMLSPAPVLEIAGGEVVLDVNFVEGMKLHCQLWPGPVQVVLRRGQKAIDEPMRYAAARLGFDLIVLDRDAAVPQMLLDESALVYCAADDLRHLDLPEAMLGRFGKTVFTVEQTLRGRIAAAWARPTKLRRKLGATAWNLRHEAALRQALRAADGIHFNGEPAYRAYRRLNRRHLRYFDNRIRAPMMARPDDQARRAERLLSGAPLRLAWYGQMTPESGVADLLPVASLLANRGLDFTLRIMGNGALFNRVRDGIAALGLKDRVTLEPMRGFELQVAGQLRRGADLFLNPRRLSTPLSAYVEAPGCGVPIVGFANGFWRRLQGETGAGWAVRNGSVAAMIRAIERLDRDRPAIVEASAKGVKFARANSFETVFSRRMSDLRAIAGVE